MRALRLLVVVFALLTLHAMARAADLVVHEWGTFTSFQDETGLAFTGINAEDEPLPDFCHKIQWSSAVEKYPSKAAQRGHPNITMRLETPVIYFHPPKEMKLPFSVDIDVQFKNGWLTQFYPDAKVGASGLKVEKGKFKVEYLAAEMTGSLSWRNLQVGVQSQPPATDLHVWTAPRKVEGASVAGANGETERFVFYRGVGRLDAPIRVVRDGSQLALHSQLSLKVASRMRIQNLWLVDFREKDSCAYRRLDRIDLDGLDTVAPHQKPTTSALMTLEGDFPASAYGPVKKLRDEMRAALIEDGLFEDEAEALLTTWELSYFKSGGMRLFFLVPRTWTDHYLPLRLSVPANISRTMVGRLEIITPQQRQLMTRLVESRDAAEQLKAYQSLGRFKEVLLARQALYKPTPQLEKFIRDNKINVWDSPE